MKSIVLALVTLLAGCGGNDTNVQLHGININHYEEYYSLFQEEGSRYGVDITVTDLTIEPAPLPSSSEGTTLGECMLGGGAVPTVELDPTQWNQESMIGRQLLVFHELGHCILHRGHIDPNDHLSIMNPYLISDEVFVANEDTLLAELFDKSTFGTFTLMEDNWRM